MSNTEDQTSNTMVVAVVAIGVYYATASRFAETDEEGIPHMLVLLAAIILYSMRQEIQNSITLERGYSLATTLASNYILVNGGSFLQSSMACILILVMLPAFLYK